MNLQDYLEKTGVSISQFSIKCGVDKSTISRLIKEPKDIWLSVALRISEATNGDVSPEELLTDDVRKMKAEFITNRGKTYRRSLVNEANPKKPEEKPKKRAKSSKK